MKHVGDITKLNGAELEPVDVVAGGSPCQNLSIAGNRKGLAGEQSKLFFEQIRVIREMREVDAKRGRSGQFVRPRFCVWENVPGALSSNGGRDFQKVLSEFVRVKEPDAPDVPMPQRWPMAGCLYGDGWSLAWRVHDAQFWGVPQRRKRIALVVDFGGRAAPEVLFEPHRLSWDSAAGGEAREAVDLLGVEALFKPLWNGTIKREKLKESGWDANPWVWKIDFRLCERPEGFL